MQARAASEGMRSFLLAFALVLLSPFALAAEPGGFWPVVPWVVQGPVTVSVEDGTGVPCVEQATGTIYAWVEWDQANFQLSLTGGCMTTATIFHGQGNTWEGWILSDYAPTHPTSGTLDGFEAEWEDIDLDMTQTLPTGETIRVVGKMVVVF